jgi:hypothetical protein
MRKTYVTKVVSPSGKRTIGYSILLDNPFENVLVRGTNLKSKVKVLSVLVEKVGAQKAVSIFYRLLKK